MKFNLNHDPNNKTLAIPRAALQLSGLAGVSDLILHTDSGCVLLLPGDPTVAELLKTISLLSTVTPTPKLCIGFDQFLTACCSHTSSIYVSAITRFCSVCSSMLNPFFHQLTLFFNRICQSVSVSAMVRSSEISGFQSIARCNFEISAAMLG